MRYPVIFAIFFAISASAFASKYRLTEIDSAGVEIPQQTVTHLVWQGEILVGTLVQLVETRQPVCLLHPCDPYDTTFDATVAQVYPTLVLAIGGNLRRFRSLPHRDRDLYESLGKAGISTIAVVEGDTRDADDITCAGSRCELTDTVRGNRVDVTGSIALTLQSILPHGARRVHCYSGVDFHVHDVVWRCTITP